MTSLFLNFCLQNVQAKHAALPATNLAPMNFNAYLTLAQTFEAFFQKHTQEESLRSARNAFDRGNSTQLLYNMVLVTLYI